MHLELDWELPCYKQEAVQVAPGMKHQATAYSEPLHSQARGYQVQKEIQQHRKRSSRYIIWTLQER